MTSVAERLGRLGLTWPTVPAPVGSYVPAVAHAGVVRTTGQLPFRDGNLVATGRLGEEVSLEEGVAAARQSALNALAAVVDLVGDVERVEAVLEVVGHVACAPGFAGHSAVLDGASDLLVELLGPAGRHVRTNVGVSSLPLRSPVEVSLVVACRSEPEAVSR